MLYYKESDYLGLFKRQLDALVGYEIPIKEQIKTGTVGSALYRLNAYKIDHETKQCKEQNLRCSFEKRTQGFILRINDKQDLSSIAFDYDSIQKITIKSEEKINPIPLSPMWLLIKLGVHLKYARYTHLRRFFGIREYRTKAIELRIETKEGYLELDSNSFNFYSQIDYFTTQSLKSKLNIIDIKYIYGKRVS